MLESKLCHWILLLIAVLSTSLLAGQTGGLRGVVYDSDFDAPLAAAKVTITETGKEAIATDEGNYVFSEVEPGKYTIVFSKDGYTRQVKADVVISEGQMRDLDSSLAGEFTDMEEFVVQDVQIGSGTEEALLELRMESPALMDSISADLMSQAGAGDAASALKLVSGATVQDGKYAVIRGLPDRYVNSQMNGVRLPTADSDKRAVQLDQFPASVIESIQVSKTFTPDQQGDASGGAVNIILKGIPDDTTIKYDFGTSWNSNVQDGDFLSYKGGGLDFWGKDDRGSASGVKSGEFDNDVSPAITDGDAPTNYKWSVAGGGKKQFDDFKLGAYGSFFYDKTSSFYDDGIQDNYWITSSDHKMVPKTSPDISGSADPTGEDFTTSLFDVTQASQQVQWGGLGVLGFETEYHSLNFLYLYTRSAEDTVTLAEDTRGKEYYFPDYDVDDPQAPGNEANTKNAAPYLRMETIEYTERTTETMQLSGKHKLFDVDFSFGNLFSLMTPELDWVLAKSNSTLYQPDKRQFGSKWYADSYFRRIFPPITRTDPAIYEQLNSGSNISYGNYQRIWKDITEDSDQYSLNLKLPFEQWTGDEGYIKFGIFNDDVVREYVQESLSNSGLGVAGYEGDWEDDSYSEGFNETNPDDLPTYPGIDTDVNYDGKQKIFAWYYMADVPVTTGFNLIGGMRFENTDISIVNTPDSYTDVTWIGIGDDGNPSEVQMTPDNKGDVSYSQSDILPSIGFVLEPIENVTFRGTFSKTVARQTFKELSPILQQEYLGGDIFVGNPDLKMSSLKNYDLRLDWTPYEGGLFSMSYFRKDIVDPIEYVRMVAPTGGFDYTTPVNYPKGELEGFEFEVRQNVGQFWDSLNGFSVGANATLINSEVTLSQTEYENLPSEFRFKKRDMVNTPEHLYNLFLTYDFEKTGTKLGLFYTIRGDTLVAGAGQSNGNYIPNVYETEYGTLNFNLTQDLGDNWKLKFQAKNLLNPKIEEVYRSDTDGDVIKSSYTKGRTFSISLSATF